MRISEHISTLIILPLMILGFYLSPQSAKADEPGEDVIQEPIRSDARRAPNLVICKMEEINKGGIMVSQGDAGFLASQTFLSDLSSYCKLYDLLARGDFEIRKVGCLKSQNSLGYNCDFIIQPKTLGEESTVVSRFFNPNGVFTSRFVPFGSKWYLAQETSPFFGAGFIRPQR